MKLGNTLTKTIQRVSVPGNGTTTKKPIGGAKTFSAPEIETATNKAMVAETEEDLAVKKLMGTKDPTGRDYTEDMAKKKIAYEKDQKAKKSVQ